MNTERRILKNRLWYLFPIYLTAASVAHAIPPRKRKLTMCAALLGGGGRGRRVTYHKIHCFYWIQRYMKLKMYSSNLKMKDLSKRREVLTQQFSFTFQTNDIFGNTAVITPNLAHMPRPTEGQICISPLLRPPNPHFSKTLHYCHHNLCVRPSVPHEFSDNF